MALLGNAPASAVVPSDRLMSATARGFASIDDIHLLSDHWRQTQLGQLMRDESMRPFIEDLKRQLERKISGMHDKLGLELADLKDVAGGEIGLALVERIEDRAAMALTVDITGHQAQMQALLSKVDRELTKQGATKNISDAAGTTFTTYNFPAKKDAKKAAERVARQAIFFIKDDMLCASDNRLEAEEMLQRFGHPSGNSLADIKPYQTTMGRCAREANGLRPEIRWYVDPFGYARAIRSLAPADEKPRGKDYLMILNSQGFDAIQGLGGFVNLSVFGSFEILHRTAVYAPPLPNEPEKYRLAMRMMNFPNSDAMDPHPWMPRKLATYRTFNCDLKRAFEYFGTLFDAIAGYEEAFDNVLEGLERDPYGPQVDVRRDFINHLGQRITLVTDYKVPITPKCERFLFAIELKDPQAIAATVEKFMKSDPNAYLTQFEGMQIWEIQEAEDEVPELDISASDLDLLAPVDESSSKKDPKNKKELPTSAVCVVHDHLFIASHVEFLKEVLNPHRENDTLSNSGDYLEVEAALSQLAPGAASAKFFLRTDEAYRPTYELLRQGKMPESETLLGRVLNRLLTPDEEEEGVLREQKIDGRKLPEFEMVRRYFGPGGTVIRSLEDGWMIVGATLSKQQLPQARAGGNIPADQSAIR